MIDYNSELNLTSSEIISTHVEDYKTRENAGMNMILQMRKTGMLDALSGKRHLLGDDINSIGITYAQKSFQLIENSNINVEALYFLNLSLMYSEVGLGVKLEDFKKNQLNGLKVHRFKKYFSEFACLLLWAILMDNRNLAIKLKNNLEFCLSQKAILKSFPLDFEYFSLWLFYRWQGSNTETGLFIKGFFKDLMDQWYAPAIELENIIRKICDYHCLETVDNDSRKFPPKFLNPPLTLLPLEIHVINKLRLVEGLEEINANHPLMNTNIAKIRDFQIIEDDLLEQIEISLF
ncbi:hypothetical protein [Alkanindiges illinoisensis]|uniref:hypothetical protein n=1 Tax=Alkanindiges illinoisensis TaxID=197183 RepID=UPI000684C9E2|nr:hypothetical protein [Alkanindiges illinoisensis]